MTTQLIDQVIVGSSDQEILFRGSPLYWETTRNTSLGINELDFLSINLRPICNYRCESCFSGMGTPQEITGTLTTEEIQNLISQARELGVLSIEISGEGEPLVDRRRLEEIIQYNNQLGIITTLFSNGSLLDREILEYFADNNVSLAISMDYFDQSDYEQHNCQDGSFDNIMRNINLAREIYSQHQEEENDYQIRRLAIHSVANARNLNQLHLIAEFCAEDIFYSIAPLANVGNATEHPELIQMDQESIQQIISKYSDGNLILSDSAREEHGQDLCGTFIYGIGIRHDGEVLFDAHAFDTAGIIGNIRDFELRNLIQRQREVRTLFYEQFATSGFCPLRDPNYQTFVQHLMGGLDV